MLNISFAAWTDNLQFHLNLTADSQDELNQFDFTAGTGTPSYSAAGADFESTESDSLYQADETITLTSTSGNDLTFCTYVKPESLAAAMIIYDEHDGGDDDGYILRIGDSGGGVYKFNVWHEGLATYYGNQLNATSSYKTCVVYVDSTEDWAVYVDNNSSTAIDNKPITGTARTDLFTKFGVYAHTAASFYDGIIRESCGWTRALSQSEITTYMNYGCEGYTAPATIMTIKSSLVDTTDYTLENIPFTFNATFTLNTITTANCSIYKNDTLINTSEYDLANNIHFNVDVSNTEAEINISLNCSNFESSDSEGPYAYGVDNIKPVIQTSFVNNSNITTDETQTFYVNFTDANLYAYNITWKKGDTVLENYFADSLTGGYAENSSQYVITDVANYSIDVYSWDSHTATELTESPKQISSSVVKYKDVSIVSDAVLIYETETDKVSFLLSDKATSLCYETTGKWIKIESEYPNHYIDFKNKVWVDDYKNKLVMITPNKICVEKIISTEINSIGDLNEERKTYYFFSYEEESLSAILLAEISSKLTSIYNLLDEVLNMLWLVILYLGLLFFGFWVIKSGNVTTGMILITGTLGFDLYFIQKIYDTYVSGKVIDSGWQSAFIWIFGVSLAMWLFVKLTFIIGSKFGTYKKQ